MSHSVEALAQALQRVDSLRKEVIANISHELRSPLTLIRGYAEMVRDFTWSDEEQHNEDLDPIISEAKRMNKMVSDILDYSQSRSSWRPTGPSNSRSGTSRQKLWPPWRASRRPPPS